MNIIATPVSELERMIPLGQAFHAEANAPGAFEPQHWVAIWRALIASGNAVIFHLENGNDTPLGIVGGLIAPSLYDPLLQASEAFWYVLPEHRKSGIGIGLLDAFELWAIEKGAKRLLMINLSTLPAASALYRKRGLRELETTWIKEL